VNGNFSRLKLDGGGTLTIEGWLRWQSATEKEANLSITVTQGANSVATTVTVTQKAHPKTWTTTVENVVLQEGAVASGQASGTVTLDDNSTVAVPSWTSTPLNVE
jgi:hypothetical protein